MGGGGKSTHSASNDNKNLHSKLRCSCSWIGRISISQCQFCLRSSIFNAILKILSKKKKKKILSNFLEVVKVLPKIRQNKQASIWRKNKTKQTKIPSSNKGIALTSFYHKTLIIKTWDRDLQWESSILSQWERDTPFNIKCTGGLPWWRSGWESACQCRGHGFKPWSGKIPHAAEQLGPWATITEPAHLEPVLHNKRGRDSERPAQRNEEWSPLAATRESPRTETKTQHSQK